MPELELDQETAERRLRTLMDSRIRIIPLKHVGRQQSPLADARKEAASTPCSRDGQLRG